jgi:hypothetical protein
MAAVLEQLERPAGMSPRSGAREVDRHVMIVEGTDDENRWGWARAARP